MKSILFVVVTAVICKSAHAVVGGELAAQGQFPYLVDLREVRDTAIFHVCHGSILDPDWVLTSAECCQGFPRFLFAVVGDYDRFDESDPNEKHLAVDYFVVHPEFNAFTRENDICVVNLNESLPLGNGLESVILPPSSTLGQGNNFDRQENSTLNIVGIGATQDGGALARYPHYAAVPVVADDRCGNIYGGAPETFETNLCIGDIVHGGLDGCTGDLGAPMTVSDTDWTLAAQYSWNTGCGRFYYPGVTTEITYFVDWIRSNTGIA